MTIALIRFIYYFTLQCTVTITGEEGVFPKETETDYIMKDKFSILEPPPEDNSTTSSVATASSEGNRNKWFGDVNRPHPIQTMVYKCCVFVSGCVTLNKVMDVD